jgi:L-fuculose-phosphate aldolase
MGNLVNQTAAHAHPDPLLSNLDCPAVIFWVRMLPPEDVGESPVQLSVMTSERQHRDEIVRYGRKLHDRFFVAATDGNLSVRLEDGTVLCSPTCLNKGMMEHDDLVIVDMAGRKVRGHRCPSSEIAMHLLIYRLRPDINAVVHAHPPTATGYAAAGLALTEPLVSEIVITLGSVPLAPYATPGTPELSDSLAPLIPDHDAILMANHGVVSYCRDLTGAYMKMETVEHFAKVALVTHTLGKKNLLSKAEVDRLMVVREQYMANGAGKRPAAAAAAEPAPAVGSDQR